jgi:hypothetical protein
MTSGGEWIWIALAATLWGGSILYHIVKIREDFARRRLLQAVAGLLVVVGMNGTIALLIYILAHSVY